MADTYTTNLNLTKPEPGAAEDTWGISLNADLDSLDAIFSSTGTQVNLNANQINFADGKVAIWGTGNDLRILHNGTNSVFSNYTGNLDFKNFADDSDIRFWSDDGAGGSAIYFKLDGSEGRSVASKDIRFEDAIKSTYGNSDDLQIYHDGSHSFIRDGGTGHLKIQATNLKLQDESGNNYIDMIDGSYVRLMHNANTKLETTSTGIDVTGTVTSDGLTVDGSGTINQSANTDINGLNGLRINDSTGTGYGAIGVVTGNDLRITSGDAGGTNDKAISFRTANAGTERQRLRIGGTGDISFYDDTGTTQGLFWDASAESLGIGTTNPNRELEIASSSPDIRLTDIEGGYSEVSGSGGQFTFKADPGNTQGGSRIAFEIDGSEKVRYNTTGVGIGTTNPTSKLHVQGDIEFLSGHKLSQDTNDNLEIRTGSSATQKGIHLRAGFGDAGNSTGVFKLYTGGQSTERLTVNADGEVTIAQDTTVNGKFVIESQSPSIELIDTNNNSDFELNNSNGVFQIFDKTVDTSRFNITSAGNVGIGTSSPSSLIHGNGLNAELRLQHTGNSYYQRIFTDSSNNLKFGTGANGTERMRITSSGELLLNKTSASVGTDGVQLRPSSYSGFSATSTTALFVNRNTDDGDVVEIGKNGVKVGSIGTYAGDIVIGTGDTGVRYDDNANALIPWNITNNTSTNGTIGLGYSTVKFTDLHLSGTANFGSLSDGTITITGFVDQDNMSSDSPTLLPTQQSVKAYVDANSFTINNNADNRIITGTATAGTLNAETTLTYGTTGADLAITGGSIGGVPPILRLEDVGSSGKLAELNHITGTTTLTSRNATSNGVIKFAGHNGTSEDEYGRFDASGNLLVGTTSESTWESAKGFRARQSGSTTITRDGNPPLYVNRLTSDGDIAVFKKGTTTVGSIGTRANLVTIGNGDTGILFNGTNDSIIPESISGVASRDAAIDLGHTSARFKDLYLSGSAYLGGTAYAQYFGSSADTNTLIQFAGSDDIRFRAGGTEQMRIKTTGVGIGTSSPSSKLDVQQATAGNIISAEFDNTDYTANNRNAIKIRQQVSSGGSYSAYLGSDKNTGNVFLSNDSITANHLVINTSGNVGIGTNSPSANLHVLSSGDTIARITSADGNGAFLDLGDASDPDGGRIVYDSGSNLGFSTASTERMRIDSSGRLGIGTSSPNALLHIEDSAPEFRIYSDNTTGGNINFIDQIWQSQIQGTTGNLVFKTGGTSERMRIDSSGNVGIGTSSPSAVLTVDGTTKTFGDSGITLKRTGSVTGEADIILAGVSGSEALSFRVNDSEKFRVQNDGNFGIGTSSPASELHVSSAAPIMTATSTNATSGFRLNVVGGSSSLLRIQDNGSERMRIMPSGNVGIGTSSPSEKLHVLGNTKITGNITVGASHTIGDVSAVDDNFFIGSADNKDLTIKAGDDSSTLRLKTTNTALTINPEGLVTIEEETTINDDLTINATTPSLNLIDTNNNSDYAVNNANGVFQIFDKTNDVSRLSVTSAGNVGIGTDSPDANLHVHATSGDGKIRITGDNITNSGGSIKGFNNGLAFNVAPSGGGSESEVLRINGSQNVGIGTASPSEKLSVVGDASISTTGNSTGLRIITSATGEGYLIFGDTADNSMGGMAYSNSTNALMFDSNSAERMRINSSGNVGINTTSPTSRLDLNGNLTLSGAANNINFTGGGTNKVTSKTHLVLDFDSDNDQAGMSFRITHNGGTELFRINNAGNVGIGTSSPSEKLHVAGDIKATGNLLTGSHTIGDATATDDTLLIKSAENTDINIDAGVDSSSIRLKTSATNRIVVDPEGLVGIGTNPSRELELAANNPRFRITDNGGGYSEISGNGGHLTLQADAGNTQGGTRIVYEIDGSEKMRLDSSGNLLVGKTSTAIAGAGTAILATGTHNVTVDGDTTLQLNRLTSDGAVAKIYKDGSIGGVLGIQEPQDNANELYIANGTGSNTVGLAFWDYIQTARIAPCNGLGAYKDNYIDLGYSGARFDDIYATNGTINTSDRNEKQDIQTLTDAEQRVATACKGLIRRFRWQDSVAEKDNNPDSAETARLHFGIIAQDLRDAFTAEGLDAGDYGMFISQTWEDDDGVEQTRLGVRYNELLAFIITTL